MSCACALSEENYCMYRERKKEEENKQTMDMHTTTMKTIGKKVGHCLDVFRIFRFEHAHAVKGRILHTSRRTSETKGKDDIFWFFF